jgi:hypothetical protein
VTTFIHNAQDRQIHADRKWLSAMVTMRFLFSVTEMFRKQMVEIDGCTTHSISTKNLKYKLQNGDYKVIYFSA